MFFLIKQIEYNQQIADQMSSFLFEREEINCNCFDNSPKNAPRIFRTDSQHSSKNKNQQNKQTSGRNMSEHGKHKKKSLKKQRQLSNVGSDVDPKQRQNLNCHITIPEVQPAFSHYQPKKQQKLMGFEYFQQPTLVQAKTERNKPVHNIRSQRSPVIYEPINFDVNYKIPQYIPTQIQSQKKIIDQIEYDKQITQEFEKDFRQFKINMEIFEAQKQQGAVSIKKRKQQASVNKLIVQAGQQKHSQSRIRYPATEHTISIVQNQKKQLRVASFRNSVASNREKCSIKKCNDKIFPKQIQSQKGSSSECQSDKESVFLGRGFDGLSQKRESFEQIENEGKRDKLNIQTMVTQQSHIKNSQINTLTEYSHTLTSPKSLYNKGMTFGGGSKYGVAGMSYQHIGDIRRPKIASSSKINF